MKSCQGRALLVLLPGGLLALALAGSGCNRIELEGAAPAPTPGEPTSAGSFEPRVVATSRARIAGVSGTDSHGYPLATADKLELLGWLRAGELDALEEALAFYQEAFAADPRRELWARDSLAAFATADPALTDVLDAWAEARPRSWQAALARAQHSMARVRREARREGSPGASMALIQRAWREVQLALVLRDDLPMAHLLAARIAQARGDGAGKLEALRRAVALAPASYLAWRALVWGLAPRLGGSHAAMESAAREARRHLEANPRLALLEGAVEADRARTLAVHGALTDALELYDRALTAGREPLLLAERARVHLESGRPAEALADLEASLALRPQDPQTLADRARALMHLGQAERARADAALAARLDPACACLGGLQLGVAGPGRWDISWEPWIPAT